MGIKQLKMFIESDETRKQQVCAEVNLRDLAEEWRKVNGKSIIVADGHNISRRFLLGYELVSGGEYKAVAQHMEEFVKAFKEIGVDLVFFFGGEAPRTEVVISISESFERKKAKEEMEELFSKIEGEPLLQQSHRRYTPIFFTKVFKDAVKSAAEFIRVNKGRDRHMVEYVIENKCLGIITDDTDLLVFDGVPHIFSRDALCLKEMTTIEYRRAALLELLGLPGNAMPIFSTLMGNDVIVYDYTKCDLYSGLLFHFLFQLDDPTVIFPELLPKASHNYKAMLSALNKCCGDL